MNKTAQLVSLWAQYEESHPDANITAFCQDYLIKQEQPKEKLTFWKSAIPPDDGSIFVKLLGRISKLHQNYAVTAFKDFGLQSFDEFLYLNSIINQRYPKKTDVILANFNELSSGLLVLARLKKSLLIREEADQDDKRTKRLSLTGKGVEVLQSCYKKLIEINATCLNELSGDEVKLCIGLLQPIENLLAKQWLATKKKV